MAANDSKTTLPPKLIEQLGLLPAAEVRMFVREGGAGFFNPLIGPTARDTCGNVADLMQLLTGMLGDDLDIAEIRPGLTFVAHFAWAAMQYEGERGRVSLLDDREAA